MSDIEKPLSSDSIYVTSGGRIVYTDENGKAFYFHRRHPKKHSKVPSKRCIVSTTNLKKLGELGDLFVMLEEAVKEHYGCS